MTVYLLYIYLNDLNLIFGVILIQPWKGWWLLFAHTFTTSFHSQKKKKNTQWNKKSASCEAHVLIQFQNEVTTTGNHRQWDFLQHATLKVTPIFVNYSGVNIVFIFGMCNLLCVVFFIHFLVFQKERKKKASSPLRSCTFAIGSNL